MIKYSSKRFDTEPKRDEYQQTSRHILPVLALWADGKRYNSVGFMVGWWKWSIHFFFSTQ